MKKHLMFFAALACSLLAAGMPTKEELSAAQAVVGKQMAPLISRYRAGKKSAADVGDGAAGFAAQTRDEAAKFLLLKGAVFYYVHAGEFDKAADAAERMLREIPGIPPEVMNEIVSKVTARVSAKAAPRLFALKKKDAAAVTADSDSVFKVNGNEAVLDLGPRGRFEFVRCPAGEVDMALASDRRTRKVKISRDFWIMKKTLGIQTREAVEGQGRQLSALCADAFPKGYVLRLPTLAEWEYAWHANTRDFKDPYLDIFALSGSGEFSFDKIMGASEADAYKTARANKWGIAFADCEQCFDRFPLCEPHIAREIKMPPGDTDVFSWVDGDGPYAFAARHVRFNGWSMNRSDNTNLNNMRYVIAPDLLRR